MHSAASRPGKVAPLVTPSVRPIITVGVDVCVGGCGVWGVWGKQGGTVTSQVREAP